MPAGQTLAIESGVVVKGRDYWQDIYVQGTLVAVGAEGEPIRFTSVDDNGGNQWGGVRFQPGSAGTIEHAVFRCGGGEPVALVDVNDAQVTIRHSRFEESGEDGIRVQNVVDPGRVLIQDCWFEGNDDDAIECNNASPTIHACSFSGDGGIYLTGTSYPDFNGDLTSDTGAIRLASTTLGRSGVWQYAGIPYVLRGDVSVPAGVILTIEPRVVVKGKDHWCNFWVSGQLDVQGTADAPVVFTAYADDTVGGDTNGDGDASKPQGNQWGCVSFESGSTGNVAHAEFRYGGGAGAGMIQIDNAQVTVAHSIFRHSGEDGIRVRNVSDPASVTIHDCQFLDSSSAGVECNNASPAITACAFAGNGDSAIWLSNTSYPHFAGDLTTAGEGIWISADNLSRSGTWEYAGIPYVLNGGLGVPGGVKLTIAPGVILKGNNYWHSIWVDGQLEAAGTPAAPIWFTAYADDLGGDTNRDGQSETPAQPQPGNWGGIVFRKGASGELAHAYFRYGGGETAGLVDIHSASVNIHQCNFRGSQEHGVYIGAYDLAGSPLAIHQCVIANNAGCGVYNATLKDVDATQNWWGDASGPYHKTLNPLGLGNPVTDHVLFEPFLGETPERPSLVQDLQDQVVAVGDRVEFAVIAGGLPPMTYEWFKDTQPIPGATGPSLVLPAAALSDAGGYQVRVQNAVGAAFSRTATLTVNPLVVQDSDWAARHVVLHDAVEAELLARTGDIDNLGFGWPAGFDPFSGASTPAHGYPWTVDPADSPGTDRIMVITSYIGTPPCSTDGYTQNSSPPANKVEAVTLQYDLGGIVIQRALLQVFVDDVQPLRYCSHLNVWLDEVSVPVIADQLNQLDQHGPIGKLMTFALPADYFPLLEDGKVELLIDDLTTGAGDGFAIDFARLLINPRETGPKGAIEGIVTDARTGAVLPGAIVSVAGFAQSTAGPEGKYLLDGLPAGLTVVRGTCAGYVPDSKTVDVLSDQTVRLNFALEPVVPIRITSIRVQAAQVELTWEGGQAPFTVQRVPDFGRAEWQSVLETSQRSALVPLEGGTAFFRIRQGQ